jgi:hypothetical protein
MIDGERIVRMPGQNFFKILHGHVVIEVIKPIKRNWIERVGGAEGGLAKRIGSSANCGDAQQQYYHTSQPEAESIHDALVYPIPEELPGIK